MINIICPKPYSNDLVPCNSALQASRLSTEVSCLSGSNSSLYANRLRFVWALMSLFELRVSGHSARIQKSFLQEINPFLGEGFAVARCLLCRCQPKVKKNTATIATFTKEATKDSMSTCALIGKTVGGPDIRHFSGALLVGWPSSSASTPSSSSSSSASLSGSHLTSSACTLDPPRLF